MVHLNIQWVYSYWNLFRNGRSNILFAYLTPWLINTSIVDHKRYITYTKTPVNFNQHMYLSMFVFSTKLFYIHWLGLFKVRSEPRQIVFSRFVLVCNFKIVVLFAVWVGFDFCKLKPHHISQIFMIKEKFYLFWLRVWWYLRASFFLTECLWLDMSSNFVCQSELVNWEVCFILFRLFISII